MKPKALTLLILSAIVMASVACGPDAAVPVQPTPNIDALVEAKVKQAIAELPTNTPYPTYTSVPLPSSIATPTPAPTITPMPTPTPPPTITPVPPPTATHTPVPLPTATPIPTPIPLPPMANWSGCPTLGGPLVAPLKYNGYVVSIWLNGQETQRARGGGESVVQIDFCGEDFADVVRFSVDGYFAKETIPYNRDWRKGPNSPSLPLILTKTSEYAH